MTMQLPPHLTTSTSSGVKLTCSCNKCGHISLVTINEGDDGIEVWKVESGCAHVPEKRVNDAYLAR